MKLKKNNDTSYYARAIRCTTKHGGMGMILFHLQTLSLNVVSCAEKYIQHASNNTTEFVWDEKRRQVIKSKPP